MVGHEEGPPAGRDVLDPSDLHAEVVVVEPLGDGEDVFQEGLVQTELVDGAVPLAAEEGVGHALQRGRADLAERAQGLSGGGSVGEPLPRLAERLRADGVRLSLPEVELHVLDELVEVGVAVVARGVARGGVAGGGPWFAGLGVRR